MLVRAFPMVVAAALLAGCGGGEEPAAPAAEDGPVHVHGLGVNPADGALFIATHTGIWRTPADGQAAERVGDSRHDAMGFTVVGPDHFLASGHPDPAQLQEGLPPHLGLMESRDGGRSWTNVSLLGEADFHALRADGARVVGLDATSGRLMTSEDGGRSWRSSLPPAPFFDVATVPGEPATLLAAAADGLYRSGDGGDRWERIGSSTGLLAWPDPDALYVVGGDGTVGASADGGRTFEARGRAGEPAAFLATDARTLYVALHDGSVQVSRDGGRTWSVRSRA